MAGFAPGHVACIPARRALRGTSVIIAQGGAVCQQVFAIILIRPARPSIYSCLLAFSPVSSIAVFLYKNRRALLYCYHYE